jgi:hypothetical protein
MLLSLWPGFRGPSRRPAGGRRNRFAAQLGIVVRYVDHCVSALVVSRAVYGLDYPVILTGIKTLLDRIAHRRAERFEFLGLMVDGAVNREGAPRPSTGRLPGCLDEDPAMCHGGEPQVASRKYALFFPPVEYFAPRSVALPGRSALLSLSGVDMCQRRPIGLSKPHFVRAVKSAEPSRGRGSPSPCLSGISDTRKRKSGCRHRSTGSSKRG